MSFDFSTLITDRTQADVSRVQELASKIRSGTASESELAEFNSAAMKGAYNHTDLNRVTAAMEALKAKLEGYGYNVPGYQRIKVPHVLPEPEPTSRLPEGYLELTYIESTGTQYIDTGFKLTSEKLRVVAEFVHTKSESSVCLFASESKSGTYSIATWLTGSAVNYAAGSSGVALAGSNYDVGVKYLLDVTADSGTITKTLNGTTKTGAYSGSLDRTLSPFIFGMNVNGTGSYKGSFMLYSLKIYDNGTLVRDFVPCKNASGVIGLYDIANNVFYQNAGSGTFLAGEEIAMPVVAAVSVESAVDETEYDPYTWYEFDWPTPENMTVYLLNVVALRSVFAVMASTPSVPKDAVGLMVQEANNIEKILVDISELLMKSTQVWLYSGELFAGEV